jgi:hypothetical protein
VRVYLPATPAGLERAQRAGALAGPDDAPPAAHAVTAAVREWYTEGDREDLEYAALLDASRSSLAMLPDDPSSLWRRVVVAADVPDDQVRPTGRTRSEVQLAGAVPISAVVSVHIDEIAAEPAVVEAVGALSAAAAGDEDAQFLLDEAEARDLLWYDVTELAVLVEEVLATRTPPADAGPTDAGPTDAGP